MIVSDSIYGKVKIDSPVLIELIKSKPVQRLKKISQYGLPNEYYHLKNITRFDHSVGVMILLKKLGASEEEQIAGLLHDVSHTAFSHVIDWVVGSHEEENFQDMQHKKFIESKGLSNILIKYKYNPKKIFDYKKFGLLERDIPELCADRVDYFLRELPKAKSRKFLKCLKAWDGVIVLTDKKMAHEFGVLFANRNIEHWGGFEAVSRYSIFAEMLKYAMDKKYIVFDDFWEHDQFVLKKLKKSKDKKILKTLALLRKKSLKHLPLGKTVVHKKFRRVDPLFLNKNKLERLSLVDKRYLKQLLSAKKKNEKGIRLPLVNL